MKYFAEMFRLALFLALAGFCFGNPTALAHETHAAPEIRGVLLADLPPEAHQTLALIRLGGPFPFPRKDGSIFGNFEKRLPVRPRGHYREYTVPTPGSRDRGARRIVAGSHSADDVTTPQEFYFTRDHYRTFRRIRE